MKKIKLTKIMATALIELFVSRKEAQVRKITMTALERNKLLDCGIPTTEALKAAFYQHQAVIDEAIEHHAGRNHVAQCSVHHHSLANSYLATIAAIDMSHFIVAEEFRYQLANLINGDICKKGRCFEEFLITDQGMETLQKTTVYEHLGDIEITAVKFWDDVDYSKRGVKSNGFKLLEQESKKSAAVKKFVDFYHHVLTERENRKMAVDDFETDSSESHFVTPTPTLEIGVMLNQVMHSVFNKIRKVEAIKLKPSYLDDDQPSLFLQSRRSYRKAYRLKNLNHQPQPQRCWRRCKNNQRQR
jgi:hypothetical protein